MDTNARTRRRNGRRRLSPPVRSHALGSVENPPAAPAATDMVADGASSTALRSSNRLLEAMASEDYARIAGDLVPIPLNRDDVLFAAGAPLSRVVFIEEGIVSIIGRSDDRRVEVGMVGREGLAGVEAVFGIDRSPYEHLVQLEGRARELDIGRFAAVIRDSDRLRDLLLRFAHVARVQAAETAISNGSQTIDRRLARWLLMYRDRTDSDDVLVTHRFLAIMLGVRRAGITEAIHRLEGERLLRARRSSLAILDRERLARFAGSAYGLPEAEFRRLIAEAGRSEADG